MTCSASSLKETLPLSPLASLFLCLYGYKTYSFLFHRTLSMVMHWISPMPAEVQTCSLATATEQALFSPRQNSFQGSAQALTVLAVCLFPYVHILHSAIRKHLLFSYGMGFHSLVHEQTVSSLPWNILFIFIFLVVRMVPGTWQESCKCWHVHNWLCMVK